MLNLIRYKATDDAIIGKIYLNGAFLCFTLENKQKAIPCGFYTVENSKSPKFGRELPLIYNGDVPASRGYPCISPVWLRVLHETLELTLSVRNKWFVKYINNI